MALLDRLGKAVDVFGAVAETLGWEKGAKIAAWLKRFGYVDAAVQELKDSKFDIRDVVAILLKAREIWKRFHPTGTLEEVVEIPRCGCPDFLPLTAEANSSYKLDPRVVQPIRIVKGTMPTSLSDDEWMDVFKHCAKHTSETCDIRFDVEFWTTAPAYGLRVYGKRLDGPGRTIADCQIPVDGGRSLRDSRFDTSETFSLDNSGRSGIPARATVLHEAFGHNLGVLHVPQNQGVAVMNPTLNYLDKWQPLDIAELAPPNGRYGKPQGGPVDPQPDDSLVAEIKIGSDLWRGTMRRAV